MRLLLCLTGLPPAFISRAMQSGLNSAQPVPGWILPNWVWPVAVLCLVPLVCHFAELTGLVDTNPLLFISSLTLHPESGILPGSPFIDGNAGQTMLPMGRLSAEDWLHFRLPWWNPYVGIGLPLAAEMQPASFMLPFILLMHFSSGLMLLKIAMQVLAGLACFGFLREIGVSRWAGLLAAILFQCNGTFALYSDAPMLPIAFLPLLLLGLERARASALEGRRGGQVLIAVSIAYSLVAGFPETAFLDGLLGLAWGIMRGAGLRGAGVFRFAGKVATGGLIGLALATPAVVPFVHSLTISLLGPHEQSTGDGLPAEHLATLLFPHLYGLPYADWKLGYWITVGGYVGTVAGLLAVVACFRTNRLAGARALMAGWIVLLLATAFGTPVVASLVRIIPGVSEVQVFRYCFGSVSFAACVLAALALDDYARGNAPRLKLPLLVFCLGAAAALGLGWRHAVMDVQSSPAGAWFAGLSLAWGATCVIAISVSMRGPPAGARRMLLTGLVVAEAVGLFIMPTLAGSTKPGLFEAPLDFLRQHQGLQRAISDGNALPQNVGALLGLGTLQHEYIPVPQNWADYVHAHLDPHATPTSFPGLGENDWSMALNLTDHRKDLEAVGVRYVVAPSWINLFSTQTDSQHPVRVFRDGKFDILELPGARPYAETIGGPCRLTIADREHMHADCEQPAQLLRRELAYPNWTARVNGQHTRVQPAGEVFQGLNLPRGSSDIVFRYVPAFANTIALLFSAGVAGLLACAWLGRPAGRSRRYLASGPVISSGFTQASKSSAVR